MKKTLIVGLTGGIASGKTTIANYLATKGAHLVDTDVIAREVVQPNMPTTNAIEKVLGSDVILQDGNLDRALIKSLIFGDKNILADYEAIILPAIREATLKSIREIPDSALYCLLIVPLLFEKGLDSYCHYTVSVDVPERKQILRAIERNPQDESVIKKIIESQLPREQRNTLADTVISNDQNRKTLFRDLDRLHEKLCQLQL